MHLILKIGISRDTECVNTVGFPKLGHIYVTGFAKTCIAHTSTFSTLKIHKVCYAYQTGMKLAGIVELLSLY